MTLLRAGILGAVDGVITSFAVVAGGDAGNLSPSAIFAVGMASVVADGLSMGISEYLSSSSEEVSGKADARPIPQGIVCFLFFVAWGVVPVGVYSGTNGNLPSTVAFTLVELMILGGMRSRLTRRPLLTTSAQTVGFASLAGVVAYGVGHLAMT